MAQSLRGRTDEGYHAAVPTAVAKNPPTKPARPWPVTMGGLLILLQGLVFLLISVGAFLFLVNFDYLVSLVLPYIPPEEIPVGLLDPFRFVLPLFIEATLSLTLALFLLSNGVRFLQRHPRAWLLAMLLQGINLLTALLLYWRGSRGLIFVWMLSSLVIVFHLNRVEVLNAFHLRPSQPEGLAEKLE